MSSNDIHTAIENPEGDGYDGKMESRLAKIESDIVGLKNDVVGLKIDVAVIRSNYVTKADLHQAKEEFHKALHDLTWRMYGFGTLLVGVVYFLDHYVR